MAHVGTSGYSYGYWGPPKGINIPITTFYDNKNKKTWLEKYSKHLSSVEINCTRYKKLTPKMCKGWIKALSGTKCFSFTIKISTYITHKKKLCNFDKWWNEFQPCLEVFDNSNNITLACILFQFPPMFKMTEANIKKLENVKKIIPERFKCAFEFRDINWYKKHTKLFTKNWTQAILYIPEVRESKFNFGNLPGGLHIGTINKDFVYMRFHGTYKYSCGTYGVEEILNTVLPTINKIRHDKTFIAAYFNNVDTWINDKGTTEGEFHSAVILNSPMIPSAVHDAKLLSTLLS